MSNEVRTDPFEEWSEETVDVLVRGMNVDIDSDSDDDGSGAINAEEENDGPVVFNVSTPLFTATQFS